MNETRHDSLEGLLNPKSNLRGVNSGSEPEGDTRRTTRTVMKPVRVMLLERLSAALEVGQQDKGRDFSYNRTEKLMFPNLGANII